MLVEPDLDPERVRRSIKTLSVAATRASPGLATKPTHRKIVGRKIMGRKVVGRKVEGLGIGGLARARVKTDRVKTYHVTCLSHRGWELTGPVPRLPAYVAFALPVGRC